MFEPFSQQDPVPTRAHGGLGLGLAIVRHLVEMHGGSVTVASAEGQGTTFTVRFPVAHALVDGGATRVRIVKGRRLDGIHALVVDDDGDGRDVLEQILRTRARP